MDWHAVLKYNPHHDPKDGRFTSGGGGTPDLDQGVSSVADTVERNLSSRYQKRQEANGLISEAYRGKSALAVELALTAKYPDKVFNLKGGVPFMVREVATAIDSLAQDYPDQFKTFKGVSIENRFTNTFNNFPNAWAEMVGDGRMFLNPKFWGLEKMLSSKEQSITDQIQEAVSSRFQPDGTNTITSIIDHEFGHHLMSDEGRSSKGRSFGLLVMELQAIEKKHDAVSPGALNVPARLFGDYAMINDHEWFACAYAYSRGRSTKAEKEKVRAALHLYYTDYSRFVKEQKARWMTPDPIKKEDLAQADLDTAGRLPPTLGPKKRFKRIHPFGVILKSNPNHDPKTGRFTDKANAFMDEWWEGTQAHPFDDRQRLRRNVGVEMSPWAGMDQVHLSSIISYGSKGKGEASELMREITQMADEHGVAIDLNAKPIPNAGAKGKGLTKAQLVAWYKRHGFKQSPGYGDPAHLTRFPATKKGEGVGETVQMNARSTQKSVPASKQYAYILKSNPYRDAKGRYSTAQNAKQQEGHDTLDTVDAMNQAMNIVGMEAFERAVMEHLSSLGRNAMGADQAYEIERVARRIVAQNPNAVRKSDITMPWQYFAELGDACRAFKFDANQPRDDRGRWALAGSGFAAPDTPEFKAWFSGSAVVDGSGNPQRVFHGTNREVTEFLPFSHFGTARAASDRVSDLYQFSTEVVGRDPGEFQVMPLYLSIKNPLRLPDLASLDKGIEHDDGTPISRAWEDEGDLMEVLHERGVVTTDEFWDHQYDTNEEIITLLESKGYDGIVYNNSVEHKGHDSYIIFRASQVKSASGNRGTYNQHDVHITKYDANQKRVPAGSPEGGQFASGIEGFPSEFTLGKDFYAYHDAVSRKEFDFKAVEQTSQYGGGNKTFEITVMPKGIPADWKQDARKRQWYDPKYMEEVTEDGYSHLRPINPSLWDNPMPEGKEEGYLFRGMSYDEYQGIMDKGYIESRGDYNLGKEQEGLTYFSNRTEQATHYAHSFAPWAWKATPNKPAVLIKIRDPGNGVRMMNIESEIGLPGRVSADHIEEVYFGHTVGITPGYFEARTDIWAGQRSVKEGSSVGYSASIRWEKQDHKTKRTKFDESKHPREPAGRSTGGQFATWRSGTGMYLDDSDKNNRRWRYGGDHSEVPAAIADRIRELRILPSAINLHLNPIASEPLQATFMDKAGKLQYVYSAEATGANAAEKFSRVKDFNAALPHLRAKARADMMQGTRQEKDTAAVVHLMAKTGFRVGGETEFATKKGKAYGATTLLDEHVVVHGVSLTFKFPGKHAVMQEHTITDPILAHYIKSRKRETKAEDRLFDTTEARVNRYMKTVTKDDFSAKDFRTWHGTMTAIRALKNIPMTTADEYRKARILVGDIVSKKLGNTRNVALESYISPTVWGRWLGTELKKTKVKKHEEE